MPNCETNVDAINRVREKLFEHMREKADAEKPGAKQFFRTRYSMVICEAGHHLTGEGDPPIECPICKKSS